MIDIGVLRFDLICCGKLCDCLVFEI